MDSENENLQEGDLFDNGGDPSSGELGGTAWPTPSPTTTAPTPEPTIMPTTMHPTFVEAGQACLEAADDGRAITSALEDDNIDVNNRVLLQRSDQLCTLWQINAARTQILPVARSYNGQKWEAAGGAFAEKHDLKIQCDWVTCAIRLPQAPAGYTYELAGFFHELPVRDQVARFLEQTTFGPTLEDLNDFTASSISYAAWIKAQQDSVPMTSHRAFYRTNLNHRAELPSAM